MTTSQQKKQDSHKPTSTDGKEETKEEEQKQQSTTQLKYKKELPSVAYLLQNGAERDPNAPPETFLQSLIMPGLLLLTFVVSLALFHWMTNGFRGPPSAASKDFAQKFAKSAKRPEF